MASELELLKSIPLFSTLPEDDLAAVLPQLERRTYAADELAVRQGEDGEELFLIQEGEFQVFLRNESLDLEKELGRLRVGQHFGEISLLTGAKRTASIRAVKPSVALVMRPETMRSLIESSPEAAWRLCKQLAELVAQASAMTATIPFVTLHDFPNAEQTYSLLAPRISALCRAIVVEHDGNRVKVALVHPEDESVRMFVRSALRQHSVEFVAIAQSEFEDARQRWFGDQFDIRGDEVGPEDLIFRGFGGEADFEGQDRPLERILAEALSKNASDVHIEPTLSGGRLRLRVDGLLFPAEKEWPHQQHHQILTQLKVISGLDTTGKKLPQDGHFTIAFRDREIDARVSTLIAGEGEKAVIRLLDPSQLRISIDAIALSPLSPLLRDLFNTPDGLVLVCGPTGCGKTTTLYAGLHEIHNTRATQNIITIEDPIEYQIEFATQIQVNRAFGLDFAHIMRAVLRQDPNVLLVGEIRDADSARLAIEAATTGHLVCSSLHTGFCLDAISRLRHLDIPPYLLAAALRGVIAQRLVPQVCRTCDAPVEADDPHAQRLVEAGIITTDDVPNLRRGAGCIACQFRGEMGRVALLEVLLVNDPLRDAIEGGASVATLRNCLTPGIFMPMHRYAGHLLRNGIIPPDAIVRALGVAEGKKQAGTETRV